MSKARVVVLEVISGHLSVAAAARAYGLSRQHVYRLLARYHQGGLDAVEPRSRRPASNPRTVSDDVIIAIVTVREELTADGLEQMLLHATAGLDRVSSRDLDAPVTRRIDRLATLLGCGLVLFGSLDE